MCICRPPTTTIPATPPPTATPHPVHSTHHAKHTCTSSAYCTPPCRDTHTGQQHEPPPGFRFCRRHFRRLCGRRYCQTVSNRRSGACLLLLCALPQCLHVALGGSAVPGVQTSERKRSSTPQGLRTFQVGASIQRVKVVGGLHLDLYFPSF